MTPRRRLEGLVTDARGRALAGAFVTVVSGPVAVPEMALTTGRDGRFALSLPPGRYALRADAQGHEAATVDVTHPSASRAVLALRDASSP